MSNNASVPRADDPHGGLKPGYAGVSLAHASFALVLTHGRGDSPEGLLPLARAVGADDGAVIAPRAAGNSWYPHRFLDPVAMNAPWLDSALSAVDRAVQSAVAVGIPRERIVLVGFSQGACLTLEYASRTPQSYGGVAALAGALIGDDRAVRHNHRSMHHTPVLLACGDADQHIPESHVRDSALSFSALGADVDLRIYPGVGHTVIADQLDALRAMIDRVRMLVPPSGALRGF